MNFTKRELVFLLIIFCLVIGWVNAIIAQQNAVTHVKGLYNTLVFECNKIIDVQEKKDFCITLPDKTVKCNQNDLNLFQSFG